MGRQTTRTTRRPRPGWQKGTAPPHPNQHADYLTRLARSAEVLREGALSARELAEDLDLVYNPPIAPAQDPLRVAAREADKAARNR